VPEIAFRQAAIGDAAEIHELLLRLAPEIPLLVDTLEREETLYALIRSCARSGESWVACDRAGGIVGFVLVQPNERARHYAENEVLDLHYAGVAAEHRRQGVFAGLIDRVLARMLPVTVRVSAQNRSGIAARLAALGFHPAGAPGGEQPFRRDPGASR